MARPFILWSASFLVVKLYSAGKIVDCHIGCGPNLITAPPWFWGGLRSVCLFFSPAVSVFVSVWRGGFLVCVWRFCRFLCAFPCARPFVAFGGLGHVVFFFFCSCCFFSSCFLSFCWPSWCAGFSGPVGSLCEHSFCWRCC